MSDHISLVGNIVGELERRTTRDGGPVAAFRLAVGERRLDRERNEWVDGHTSFYAISAFGDLGANALRSLRKGERVVVTGRLRLREWENETTRGVSADVVADAIGHDLRWGTTRFVRAERPGDAASGPSEPAHEDESEQARTDPAGADGWAVPGAGAEAVADREQMTDAVPVGGGDGPF
ncbi:single-stranded DNA-binding protein [Microbacterium testaceum]|uniref:single-stranded DNA-binding protein n=1 Tax=Microbacterium testaceum TaxID=2033 RepID=UPI0022E5A7D7|nr:single-stranded DNA-binding protein [Microbacterium testaceum]